LNFNLVSSWLEARGWQLMTYLVPMAKTAFITGATAGFGKSCAEIFSKNGWHLILNGRRIERLASLKTLLEKNGSKVLLLPFDVQDQSAVFDSIKNIPPEFQKIDLLINNAGLAL
jgi:NADP-dependent 3-hydroxy acid dehydrogenase YdfG